MSNVFVCGENIQLFNESVSLTVTPANALIARKTTTSDDRILNDTAKWLSLS